MFCFITMHHSQLFGVLLTFLRRGADGSGLVKGEGGGDGGVEEL